MVQGSPGSDGNVSYKTRIPSSSRTYILSHTTKIQGLWAQQLRYLLFPVLDSHRGDDVGIWRIKRFIIRVQVVPLVNNLDGSFLDNTANNPVLVTDLTNSLEE